MSIGSIYIIGRTNYMNTDAIMEQIKGMVRENRYKHMCKNCVKSKKTTQPLPPKT